MDEFKGSEHKSKISVFEIELEDEWEVSTVKCPYKDKVAQIKTGFRYELTKPVEREVLSDCAYVRMYSFQDFILELLEQEI